MKRLSLVITILLAIPLIVFAISNRERVDLSLWPFALVSGVPLYALALGMLALGMLAGALWMVVPVTRWRLRTRASERRVLELEAALAESRAMVTQLRDTPPEPRPPEARPATVALPPAQA